MRKTLMDVLDRAVPTTAQVRHDWLWVTAMTVPLWVLVHLLGPANALPPLVQVLVVDVQWVMNWLFLPVCAVITVVSGALAIRNREARDLLPYAVLALLDVAMLCDVFARLSVPPLS